MLHPTSILFLLFLSITVLRADLVMEQQSSDTNSTRVVTVKLHGDKMRMDQPAENFSVIADFSTRDSYTLLSTNETYLKRWGSEIKWEMSEERKKTGGTNELDAQPARATDTGKSEMVNGYEAKIYTWAGAFGLQETLWVATKFPGYNEIRAELFKVDKFNDTGPHRNAQPILSVLPGMVVKSESTMKGRTMTNLLISAKLEPVDASLFEIPTNYSRWNPQNKTP